jgi:hypothetical protein
MKKSSDANDFVNNKLKALDQREQLEVGFKDRKNYKTPKPFRKQLPIITREVHIPHCLFRTISQTSSNSDVIKMHTLNDCSYAHYVYIVELNNIGADLMEFHAYRSATQAFREAIRVMRAVIRPSHVNREEGSMTPQAIGNAVLQARQQFFKVQASPKPSDHLEELRRMGRPVRIDLNAVDCQESDTADTISALLLYNFGLVNRWASADCQSSHCEIKAGALKLFKMSLSILTPQEAIAHIDPEELSDLRLYLLSVVLDSLSVLEAEMGNHQEANAIIEQMVHVTRIAAIKKFCGSFSQIITASAA